MKMIKKIVLFCLFACCINLTGCTSAEYTDSKDEEHDSQNYWGGTGHELAASENGYYFIDSSMLMFFDRESKRCVPLCNKTDCNHLLGDKSCDAYLNPWIYMSSCGIYYYDKNIYILGAENENSNNINLYKISEDGSKRTKLGYMFKGDLEEGISIDMNIFKGYAYYSLKSYSENKSTCELYRLSLDGKGKPELVDSFEGYSSEYLRIRGAGGYLYYQTSYCAEKNSDYSGDIYQYDIKKKRSKKMVTDYYQDYTIFGNQLFYNKDAQIIKMDLSSQKESLAFEKEGETKFYLSCDGNYVYLDNSLGIYLVNGNYSERKVYVLDMNGKEIDTIEIGNDNSVLFGDPYMFFMTELNGKGGLWKAFDKSEIGKDKIKWMTVFSGEDLNYAEDETR